MATNKNEAETMTKQISCDCKFKFNNTTCNSNKHGAIKHANVQVKTFVPTKEIIVGIVAHAFVGVAST